MHYYLAVVTAELADDAARGDVPIEDLSVGSAGHQFRVIPVQKTNLRMNRKKHLANFPLPRLRIRCDATKGDKEMEGGRVLACVREYVRGRVHVADLAGVGLVGLDVGAGVRIPEAERAVLAAAQAVVAVPVEPHGQHRPLVTRQRPRLRPRQLLRGRPRGRHRLLSLSAAAEDGMDGRRRVRRPPEEMNGGPGRWIWAG